MDGISAVEHVRKASAGSTQRWVSVGHSADPDARTAGRAAATAALAHGDARLTLMFASVSYDLPSLLAEVRHITGDVPLVGATTAGEIGPAGVTHHGVVVVALGGPGFSVGTRAVASISGRLREAGAEVAAALREVDDRAHKVLLLLTDGLVRGDQQDVINGAYELAGPSIPIVGGCAGDGLKLEQTTQFYNDEILHDAALGVVIASDSPIGVGVRHGWRHVGDSAMLVTKSDANFIYTLDDRPALDVYLDKLGAPDDVRTDPAAFSGFALSHPLGLNRRKGREARSIAQANFQDRSLWSNSYVPQGSMVWIMEGDGASNLDSTDAACAAAIADLRGHEPIGFLAFDCAGRRLVLGDEGILEESSRLGHGVAGLPLAGLYTYGEFARTFGTSGFHNQTLVILAMS